MNRMNRLIKIKQLIDQQQLIKRTIVFSRPVLAGQAKDYKPGPYPKTEEDRIAAAHKYGLKPEDYEPMPDDGLGYGDYPKLAPVSSDMKSDFEEWDDVFNKRNFGEPVNVRSEQITNEKVTYKAPIYPWSTILSMFLGAGALFFGLYYTMDDYKFTTPIAPKQYPRDAHKEKHIIL